MSEELPYLTWWPRDSPEKKARRRRCEVKSNSLVDEWTTKGGGSEISSSSSGCPKEADVIVKEGSQYSSCCNEHAKFWTTQSGRGASVVHTFTVAQEEVDEAVASILAMLKAK